MRLEVVVAVLSVLSVCLCVTTEEEEEWKKWKARYEKNYESQEKDESRRRAWMENADFVAAHNARDDVTYKLELNMFADQLSEASVRPVDVEEEMAPAFDEEAPARFGWREKKVVTGVKNQGPLGDAEAYVAAECVESFHAIGNGHLYELSIQEVWSCCRVDDIGLPIVNDVFGCIHNIGGLCENGTFPVTGKCAHNSCDAVAQTTGTKYVLANDETALLQAVLKVPVFVTINASPQSFLMYKSGVYSDPNCTGRSLDHVLQVVGYGADDKGNPYWICRNSWGTEWGMDGYILIQRGVNRCGIAADAKYPY